MKKVMCFGTFDFLHLGHLNYFKQAKEHGDYLIVVLARDATKLKQGKKTIFAEEERREIVENQKIVDKAILGSLNNHLQIITEEKPEVICLGYDQEASEQKLKEDLNKMGISTEIKRMKPYQTDKNKSSLIKEKILRFLND